MEDYEISGTALHEHDPERCVVAVGIQVGPTSMGEEPELEADAQHLPVPNSPFEVPNIECRGSIEVAD